MVFAAGTIDWSWALDDYWRPGLVDPRLQRTTANILAAFRAGEPPAAAEPRADRSPAPVFFGAAAVALAAACVPLWLLLRRAGSERARGKQAGRSLESRRSLPERADDL
jgi:hypothetical protein